MSFRPSFIWPQLEKNNHCFRTAFFFEQNRYKEEPDTDTNKYCYMRSYSSCVFFYPAYTKVLASSSIIEFDITAIYASKQPEMLVTCKVKVHEFSANFCMPAIGI